MRDDDLSVVLRTVAVAVVAADVLVHLGIDLVEVHGVDTDTQLVDQLREVRGLACQTVCKGVRTGCCGNIRKSILMTSRTSVFLGESESLIDVHKVRILLQIIGDVAVLVVGMHRRRHVRE